MTTLMTLVIRFHEWLTPVLPWMGYWVLLLAALCSVLVSLWVLFWLIDRGNPDWWTQFVAGVGFACVAVLCTWGAGGVAIHFGLRM